MTNPLISQYWMQQYLQFHGMPTTLNLTELPDASTMRKIRYRANRLIQKGEEFLASTNLTKALVDDQVVSLNLKTAKFELRRREHEVQTGSRHDVARVRDLDYRIFDLDRTMQEIENLNLIPDRLTLNSGMEGSNKRIRLVSTRLTNADVDSLLGLSKWRSDDFTSVNILAYRDNLDGVAKYGIDPGDLIAFVNLLRCVKEDRNYNANYRDSVLRRFREGKRDGYVVPTHDTTENLESFLSKRRRSFSAVETSTYNIDTLTIADHGTLSSRTWGIEVETGGARHAPTPRGWDRKYDGSLRSAYNEDGGWYGEETEWIEEEDCRFYYRHVETPEEQNIYLYPGDVIPGDGENAGTTVIESGYYEVYNARNRDYLYPGDCEYHGEVESEYDEYDDDTAEFVSPILRSFHSKGLEVLVEHLATQPQNDSAGIHVHVGAEDLTAKQVGGLVFAYEMIEPLLETSYMRTNREYCRVRRLDETMDILKSSKTAKFKSYSDRDRSGGSGDYLPYGDRYVSLNLCSLDAHGTVEFRAMGPVYEYEHLIKWAHFCREMVNLAAKDIPLKEWSAVKSFADVRALFAKYGVEHAAAVFSNMSELTEMSNETSQLTLAEV